MIISKKNIFLLAVLLALGLAVQPSAAQNISSKFNVGDKVPNFTGIDQFGEKFELNKTLKDGPVVLIFYRGYWCPYCNQQLSQLNDSLKFITEQGGTVVAVTPEAPEGIQKTVKKTGASFKIIYDENLSIMNLYGVGFRLDEATIRKYKSYNIPLDGKNGPNLPVPATYIVNSDSKILYAFYDPDYKKRATVGKILENL